MLTPCFLPNPSFGELGSDCFHSQSSHGCPWIPQSGEVTWTVGDVPADGTGWASGPIPTQTIPGLWDLG